MWGGLNREDTAWSPNTGKDGGVGGGGGGRTPVWSPNTGKGGGGTGRIQPGHLTQRRKGRTQVTGEGDKGGGGGLPGWLKREESRQ